MTTPNVLLSIIVLTCFAVLLLFGAYLVLQLSPVRFSLLDYLRTGWRRGKRRTVRSWRDGLKKGVAGRLVRAYLERRGGSPGTLLIVAGAAGAVWWMW